MTTLVSGGRLRRDWRLVESSNDAGAGFFSAGLASCISWEVTG